LKPLSGKQMRKVVERHGWILDHIKGSHHIFRKPGVSGNINVPIHGNKTLKPKTQRNIMRQAGLTDDDL
jgi:predicted RNA binding protein YcfA (HicA-like mRNA interferase family)